MEFWEGAVLIVGGIWLVGRMHRIQTRSVTMGGPVPSPAMRVPGATSETNLDGSGYLVAGESLATGTVRPISESCPTCSSGLSSIIAGQSAPARANYQKPLAVQF